MKRIVEVMFIDVGPAKELVKHLASSDVRPFQICSFALCTLFSDKMNVTCVEPADLLKVVSTPACIGGVNGFLSSHTTVGLASLGFWAFMDVVLTHSAGYNLVVVGVLLQWVRIWSRLFLGETNGSCC